MIKLTCMASLALIFTKYNFPHTLKPWNTRANVGQQQDPNDATGYRCLFIYYLYWQLKLRLAYASIQVIYDLRQTRNSCDIIHQPLRTILHQNDKSSFSSWLWWCVTTSLPWSYCYGPGDPPRQKRPHCQYWCSMWLLTSASLVFVERLVSCSSPAWAVATSPQRQPTWNVNLKELKQ